MTGMVEIPGGEFLMGSDRHYPEERPAHRVKVDGFWMDQAPVTNAQFRAFVEATGPCDPGGAAGESRALPGRAAGAAGAGVGRVPPAHADGWICATISTGGPTCRGPAGATPAGPPARSMGVTITRRARRLRGRGGLRRLGGQAPAQRGGVGVRRSRRAGRGRVRLGGRAGARRLDHGQHLAGRVPGAEASPGRLRLDLAGGEVSRQRVRPLRHGREMSGNGPRTGTRSATRSTTAAVAGRWPTPGAGTGR